MLYTKNTQNMPGRIFYPRKLSVNGEHYSSDAIAKTLPYVDVQTGTNFRIITRDPISGLGNLPAECNPFQNCGSSKIPRPITQTPQKRATCNIPARDPIAGRGDLGIEYNSMYTTSRNSRSRCKNVRNPVTHQGLPNGGVEEADKKRCRSRVEENRDPIRDPISGAGNFGREWDPIWKYKGAVRRSISVGDVLRNPINHNGVENSSDEVIMRRKQRDPRNPILGKNAPTYNISTEENVRRTKSWKERTNVITGENCNTYMVTPETDKHTGYYRNSPSHKTRGAASNPMFGENCPTFTYTKEARPIQSKAFDPSNPLNGQNIAFFNLFPNEKIRTQKTPEHKNPLTGNNHASRDEHKRTRSSHSCSGMDAPLRNTITGANCETFSINKELRSEKRQMSLAYSTPSSRKGSVFSDEVFTDNF